MPAAIRVARIYAAAPVTIPAIICGFKPVFLIIRKYSYWQPERITRPVRKNETGWSQNPPKMKMTIHAPVNVRLKKLFKISGVFSFP